MALKAVFSILLGAALLIGCGDDASAGCVMQDIVLDQCLTSSQCPECTLVCEDRSGTRAGGPDCALIIGFGFFCVCACEFCFGSDSGQ